MKERERGRRESEKGKERKREERETETERKSEWEIEKERVYVCVGEKRQICTVQFLPDIHIFPSIHQNICPKEFFLDTTQLES